MALAMQSNMSSAQDADLMDIDIDMELDEHVATLDDEFQLEEGEEPSFVPTGTQAAAANSDLIPAIYTEDPGLEPQWNKVHIRGVDDLHTRDIVTFAQDHYGSDQPEKPEVYIQWIDDTSANICFKDSETAKKAHLAFLQHPISAQELINAPFEPRTAKPLTTRPASMLVVRVAQVKDRKAKNARDASRYYLLHPDQDPTDRMRREFANSRGGGRSDNGDYRRRRFDDREYRRRRDNDHDAGGEDFSANMYDDAPATDGEPTARGRDLFSRVSKGRRRSASPTARTRNSDEIDISDSEDDRNQRRRNNNGYRDRTDRSSRNNAGKELFGDSGPTTTSSSLTRRPPGGGLHSDRIELFPSKTTTNTPYDTDTSMTTAPSRTQNDPANVRANAAAAKRLKADLLNAAQTSPRGGGHHRRSHAMDAKNAEDLAERFARKSISLDSTKSLRNNLPNSGVELFPSDGGGGSGGGLNIKGSAGNGNGNGNGFNIKGSGGLSIKGRADVKELFPGQYDRSDGNAGKELFDQPVRERRQRRQARDLFD